LAIPKIQRIEVGGLNWVNIPLKTVKSFTSIHSIDHNR
jgi:hypothetical protein